MTLIYGMTPKIRPEKIRYCPLVKESAVICQLPLKMAEERDFENGRISNFQRHDLDLGSGHMAYRRASLIDHYVPNFIDIVQKFLEGHVNFLSSSKSHDTKTRTDIN